jgi:hypothetical protein
VSGDGVGRSINHRGALLWLVCIQGVKNLLLVHESYDRTSGGARC